MNGRPTNFLAAIALGAVALSGLATGCELIASVDRSQIPGDDAGVSGNGGSGGKTTSTGGAGGTSSSQGGSGGTTSAGGHGGHAGQGGAGGAACDPKCGDPTEPDCETIKCVDGKCESTFQSQGTKLPDAKQTAGDCKVKVCDGAGKAVDQNDDTDRVIDNNDCISHTCSNGAPQVANVATGTKCMANNGAVCDGNGTCVACNVDADCSDAAKPHCDTNKCVPATCTDKVKNGDETDVDCGGACAACADGKVCSVPADCTSKNCQGQKCAAPACDDGILNGNETDVDCGGSCKPCGPTLKCGVDADCVGKQCDANAKTCTPNCADGVKNNAETDADCGGGTCGKCADTKLCSQATDCSSNGCCAGTCGACCNGVKDATETDVDCGGSCAQKCGDDKACTGNADCSSNLCQNFTCKPSSCSNNVKDNDETDVDCGGSCQPCTNGKVCAKGTDCASTFCADGVCCNVACGGLCEACVKSKTGQADGACNAVSTGTDPDNECTDNGAGSCNQNGFCDGARACQKYAQGTVCLGASCSNGTQTNQSVCDGKGNACPQAVQVPCGEFICGANACKTACAADNDCVAGDYCKNPGANGVCTKKAAQGGTCSGNNQCMTGFCVDGFCCDTACSGTCQACSAAKQGQGTDGTCGPIKLGNDPDNECSDQGAASCGTSGNCDGASACALYPANTTCGSPSCTNGTQTATRLCDGKGVCKAGEPTSCGAYACGQASCNATCATDTDCASGNWCDTGASPAVCTAKLANGQNCAGNNECVSNNCVVSDAGTSTCQ
jgi:hypothetical protein